MMKSSSLGNVINRIEKGVHQAFMRVNRLFNESGNRDLSIYENLDIRDLQALADIYGQEQVLDYIRTMETKRMLGEGSYGKVKFNNLS